MAILALLLAVRPNFGQLSPPRQRTLAFVRGLILLVLATALLRPARLHTDEQAQKSTLVVMLDTSRSLLVPDGEGGRTRWQVLREIMSQAVPQLNALGDKFEVDLLGFDARITAYPLHEGRLELPATATGEQTDLGTSLAEALQRQSGKRLAGVIMLTDGAQRAYAPRVQPQQAARDLARRGTPFYPVLLGRSQDQSQGRDVAVEQLQDQYTVYVKNEFVLRAGIRVQGYPGKPIPVRVMVEDRNGQSRELGPVNVTLSSEGGSSQVIPAEFSFVPTTAGQYKLTVDIPNQPGELVTDNNRLTTYLNVLEGGLRVLVLTSSLLHPEPKFIRRSLTESPDIQLDFQAIDRRSENFDLARNGKLAEYDVFVIGDVDARSVQADSWRQLAQLVDRGKGLLMYGGYHSFGPGGFADTPLSLLLPVKMRAVERQPLDPALPVRTDVQLNEPLKMIPVTDDFITHMAPASENRAVWERLPDLWGANVFDLKDRVTVLATTADGKHPLLVQAETARGRVLASAVDSTWRWYKYGRQDIHKRFWRQAILWLASRDQKQDSQCWIELAQRRVPLGGQLQFAAGARDANGDEVTGVPLVAEVEFLPTGKRRLLPLSANGDHWTGTVGELLEAGDYRVHVRVDRAELNINATAADFAALEQDLELTDPAANPGLMEMLAKITQRAGGKTLAPEQLPDLIEEIKNRPPRDLVRIQSKWQLGDTATDAWIYFLLVVGLLTAEWVLRKKWGLV